MNQAIVRIGKHAVGDHQRVFVVAEIGINHNGSLELARQLIDGAKSAGCDAVKFQKRTPELCVPKDQWHVERDTPWGRLSYIDYRHKIEFEAGEYEAIDRYCRERDILWFASCWDEESVDFMSRFEPPCFKAASASITDTSLLRKFRSTGRPLFMSTGMSTFTEIERAVAAAGTGRLLLAHSTSSYPCPVDEINLRMLATLKAHWPECPIGYSGHEAGLAPTWAAVAMGATFVERHITLDRAMWGTDQAASVDIDGLARLVANIRDIERALGDGIKRIHDGETRAREKLRRVRSDVRPLPVEAERPRV